MRTSADKPCQLNTWGLNPYFQRKASKNLPTDDHVSNNSMMAMVAAGTSRNAYGYMYAFADVLWP